MTRKILLVDDSPVARKILRKCIPEDGCFEIFEASDGLDGLKKFEEINPDITFMDLTMPVMDGMEALGEIRKRNKDALVIIQTADTQIKSVFMAMELGAFMVLKKPISKDSIKAVLKEADGVLQTER